MKLKCYFEILLTDKYAKNIHSAILLELHRNFNLTKNGFAISFPQMREDKDSTWIGNKIVVFAEQKEDLDLLAEKLSNIQQSNKFSCLYPKNINLDDREYDWFSYSRLRIPTRKDCEKNEKVFAKRLKRLDESRHSVFFQIYSASNDHRFSLSIKRKQGVKNDEVNPTSYGLSSASHPFCLPIV